MLNQIDQHKLIKFIQRN